MLRKIISLILCFSLFLTHAGLAEVGQTLNLSNYLNSSPKTLSPLGFQAPVLRYFSYDAGQDNFQLLLDPQDLKDKLSEDQTKSLAYEQLNYFMVGLTLPNSKFWVNLRPDAPDNIIEPELEQTEVGRIMLESDLQLKKDTAAFTSPQTNEGREYWDKLYQKAKELFGSEPANIPTITRPWIVPGEILIREDHGAAYVYKATLKVMLEEDYLKSPQSTVHSPQYSFKDPRMKELNSYSSQLIRELILPKLTQEVNSGKNYASLRQVYFSLVLSRWFKMRFGKPVSQLASKPVNPLTGKPANLSQLIDRSDLTGLTSKTPWSKETYFKEYQKSFAQGEYNLKEQVTTPTGQVIRSYVSGGGNFKETSLGTVSVQQPTATRAGSPLSKRIKDIIYGAIIAGSVALTGYFGYDFVKHELQQRKFISDSLEEQKIAKEILEKGYNRSWLEEVVAEIVRKKDPRVVSETKKSTTFKDYSTTYYTIQFGGGWDPIRITKVEDPYYRAYGISVINLVSEKEYNLLNYYAGGASIGVSNDGRSYLSNKEEGSRHPKSIEEILEKLANYSNVQPNPLSSSSPLTLEKAKEEIDKILGSLAKVVKDSKSDPFGNHLLERSSIFRVDFNVKNIVKSMRKSLKELETDDGLLDLINKWTRKSYSPLSEIYYIIRYKWVLVFGQPTDSPELIEQYKKQESGLELFNSLYKTLNKIEEELVKKQKFSSALSVQPTKPQRNLAEKRGGIDWTELEKYFQFDGSFKGLDLSLPLLSKKELESLDLEKEEETLRNYLATGFNPNGDRLKRLLAGLFQKDEFTSEQLDLLRLSQELCNFLSARGLETTLDQRAFILIADTGLFLKQGAGKASIMPSLN